MSESHDLRRRGPTAGATGGHFEERGTSAVVCNRFLGKRTRSDRVQK